MTADSLPTFDPTPSFFAPIIIYKNLRENECKQVSQQLQNKNHGVASYPGLPMFFNVYANKLGQLCDVMMMYRHYLENIYLLAHTLLLQHKCYVVCTYQ